MRFIDRKSQLVNPEIVIRKFPYFRESNRKSKIVTRKSHVFYIDKSRNVSERRQTV